MSEHATSTERLRRKPHPQPLPEAERGARSSVLPPLRLGEGVGAGVAFTTSDQELLRELIAEEKRWLTPQRLQEIEREFEELLSSSGLVPCADLLKEIEALSAQRSVPSLPH